MKSCEYINNCPTRLTLENIPAKSTLESLTSLYCSPSFGDKDCFKECPMYIQIFSPIKKINAKQDSILKLIKNLV